MKLFFSLFTCFFTFYSIVSEIVYMQNCFIHELELENDRGTIDTSFLLFFIACFYNKIFLFCFVVLRSQIIWTNLEETKLNIYSNRCTVYRRKKRNMISKFDHRKLAFSMSSTNVGKNSYHSISLILTLG